MLGITNKFTHNYMWNLFLKTTDWPTELIDLAWQKDGPTDWQTDGQADRSHDDWPTDKPAGPAGLVVWLN